jgi:rubrerythrin
MSIFHRAGQRFQETKEQMLGGEEFACRTCERAVEREYDHCPHCGEPTVVSVE